MQVSRAARMAFQRIESEDLKDCMGEHQNLANLDTMTKDLRQKYRQKMIENAQLDNEKQALSYCLHDLKDQLEEHEDVKIKLEVELKSQNQARREQLLELRQLQQQQERLMEMKDDRDRLIKDHNLLLVAPDQMDNCSKPLLSAETLKQLGLHTNTVHELSSKLKVLLDENSQLKKQIKKEKLELDIERDCRKVRREDEYHSKRSSSPTMADLVKIEREQLQVVNEHKRLVNQAYLKIDSLENKLLRLESQMHRYREVCEESEKVQTQVKSESRRISRQVEEAQRQVEELKTENGHLENRIHKVRQVRETAAL